MRRISILSLCALSASCGGDGKSLLVVTVDDPTEMVSGIATLHVTAAIGGAQSQPLDYVPAARTIPPKQTLGLRFPADRKGRVDLTVEARGSDGSTLATASGSATVVPGQASAVTVLLGSSVTNSDSGAGSMDLTMAPSEGDDAAPAEGDSGVGTDEATGPMPDLSRPPPPDLTPFHSLNWTAQTTNTQSPLNAVWGTKSDVFAVGSAGTILHSTGTGNWTPQTSPATTTLHGVAGGPAGHVFIVGGIAAPVILYSIDAGATWTAPTLSTPDALLGIADSGQSPLAVGFGGAILYTNDLGATWMKATSGVTGRLIGAWWIPGGSLYALGEGGQILESTSAASGWMSQLSGTGGYLYGMWGSSATDLYIAGDNGVILHGTGNGTWKPFTAVGTTETLTGIWGSGPTDIYVCGSGIAGFILHSGDAGITWTRETLPAGTANLSGIWGNAANDVYAVGAQGTILRGH